MKGIIAIGFFVCTYNVAISQVQTVVVDTTQIDRKIESLRLEIEVLQNARKQYKELIVKIDEEIIRRDGAIDVLLGIKTDTTFFLRRRPSGQE